MHRHFHFIHLLIMVGLLSASIAIRAQQKKDSTHTGTIDGIIRDSSHNYVLQAASVAVYNAKDTSLVSYQLTNNFGEFHFKDIPAGIPLIIKVFYVGYGQVAKIFTIPKDSKILDLKELNLTRTDNELQDVEVKSVPPVQMNGDTLEL